ncbi:MAG: Cell division ATP-binding protein FtsE [Firmicutes bacterium ADurb.Bin300]|nr:MAG: Cell division ATP-binding protein FtsE [Firmicutes bacterium ADurb.Bin300]
MVLCLIEFSNVTKVYDNSGIKALQNVNIKIEKGEFVFVVGSSGAGKSTFLKLIMREEVPTSGEISVNGCDLNLLRRRQIPYFRRTLGIVFQDFRLIPTMNVFDNVAFAMRVVGARESEIRKRVPYVLGLVGLSSKSKSLPTQLSGGEQQRVALARALTNNAGLIIADEPTGNIDPEMSYEIVDLLNHINAEGTTVVMVTHEHSLVRKFNKRVIKIEQGKVVADANDASSLPIAPQEDDENEREGTYFADPQKDLDFEYLMRTYGVDSAQDEILLSENEKLGIEDELESAAEDSKETEKAGDAE